MSHTHLLFVVEVGVVADAIEGATDHGADGGDRSSGGRCWADGRQLGDRVPGQKVLSLLVLGNRFKTLLLKLSEMRKMLLER